MSEWDSIAPYYDEIFEERTFDIPFWVRLAKQFGSSVLELTCGSGRLTFPIAQAGIQVTGLDISAPMLRVARKNRQSADPAARRHVDFVRGDAINFYFRKKKFRAVFSPWGFVPVTCKEQEIMLFSIKRALTPSGYVVIDIENSKEPERDWNIIKLKECVSLPKLGTTYMRQAYNTGTAATKIGRIIFTLDIIPKNGSVKRLITERTYRVYTVQDIKSLLVSNGFRIVTIYGDYDFSPWTPESRQAIVIAQLSDENFVSKIINRISAVLH